jgi:hypothetical protein
VITVASICCMMIADATIIATTFGFTSGDIVGWGTCAVASSQPIPEPEGMDRRSFDLGHATPEVGMALDTGTRCAPAIPEIRTAGMRFRARAGIGTHAAARINQELLISPSRCERFA